MSPVRSQDLGSRMARHTVSGVSGMSRCVTPRSAPPSLNPQINECPLWVKSRHKLGHPFTSAFGGKADVQCPLFESEAFLP